MEIYIPPLPQSNPRFFKSDIHFPKLPKSIHIGLGPRRSSLGRSVENWAIGQFYIRDLGGSSHTLRIAS